MCKDLVTCKCKCADCIHLIEYKATRTDPADAECEYRKEDDDGTCQDFGQRDVYHYPRFDECTE
jgi:hypothetical protein